MEISNAYYQTLAAGHGVEETAARCAKTQQLQQAQERRQLRPAPPEKALQCPRCASTNTKFCYYNNYSLSQPRHFCKGCKRYWTQGGSLRNVPVRGGCRKHKKHSSSSSSSSSSSKKASSEQDLSSSITALIPPPNLYFAGQPPTKQLVGASAIPSGFLDMLRSGSVGSAAVVGGGGAAHGSFGSVYCGGEENAELWFESTQAAISPSTINSHLPWQDAAGSMLLDCSWSGNAAVGDSWQGLIDSSLL